METNDHHDEQSLHQPEGEYHFHKYHQIEKEIKCNSRELKQAIKDYESFKIVEKYGGTNYFFPADFSIQFKSLGEFDFSTLRCEVEVLVRIKIFCYKFPKYIDDFFLKTTLIWEDGTVEKLTPEKCLFIDKDQNERQVKFMFLRKITCTIQGKMFTSPIQQINMYTSLQIQPISIINKRKQQITLRVNFPDFSIQKKKRNDQLIRKIMEGNFYGKSRIAKLKERIARVKEMKNKITEKFQINFCGHSPQKIQQQNPKKDQNNQGSKGEINTVVKGRKNYKAFDLRFEANFKNKYYLPAKYLYQMISAYENYQDEVDKLNIHSKMNFFGQESQTNNRRDLQKNKKQIQYSQAGPQNSEASHLKQYNFQLYSHNQVRMKIKIYKEPIQTLLAIMLPVGLLSFINCAIFFQPPSLQDRIGSIASILIAYGTTVLQVRRQIAPATQWTLMEIVLYFQTICCILTLVHGMRILNQKEATYNFDWTTNQLFLTVLIASLICTLVFILVALKYLFYNLPKYKYNFREQQQKKKQNLQKTEQYAIVLAKKNKGKRKNAQIAYKGQKGSAQFLSFNQVRMKIKVYKRPFQTLLAIMLPVGLLSFINCAIFFQPPSLEDRIGSIASILIAYGTTVLQIRRQIAKATDWTLMEIVLYLQTICCILTLAHGMRTMYYDKEYKIDWTSNQLFLTVFSVSILCVLVFIFLAIKYCVWNLPKYKSEKRELFGVKWLEQQWNGDCEDNSEKNPKSALDTQGQLYRGTSESDLI